MTIEEILNDSSLTSEEKLEAIKMQNSINEMQKQAEEMKATINAWNTEKAENTNAKEIAELRQQIADMKQAQEQEQPDETDNAFWDAFSGKKHVGYSDREKRLNEHEANTAPKSRVTDFSSMLNDI